MCLESANVGPKPPKGLKSRSGPTISFGISSISGEAAMGFQPLLLGPAANGPLTPDTSRLQAGVRKLRSRWHVDLMCLA